MFLRLPSQMILAVSIYYLDISYSSNKSGIRTLLILSKNCSISLSTKPLVVESLMNNFRPRTCRNTFPYVGLFISVSNISSRYIGLFSQEILHVIAMLHCFYKSRGMARGISAECIAVRRRRISTRMNILRLNNSLINRP